MPTDTMPRYINTPRLKKLHQDIKDNPQRASSYKELARLLREKEQFRQASIILRKGLKSNPGDLGLLQHLARTQHQGGFSAAAVRTWKTITRNYPDNYLAYEKLERHYVRAGQHKKAVNMYQRVKEDADFKEKSLERIVFVCKEKNDIPGTLKALKKLVRGYGITKNRAKDLGRFHFKADNFKESSHWLKQAFRLGEDNLDLRLTLALAYARQEVWDKAHEQINFILTAKPDNYAGLINLCEFYLLEKKLTEAQKVLDRVDALYSNNSRAHLARGELALCRDDFSDALQALKTGIRGTAYFYRWELMRGYNLLAQTWEATGEFEEAKFARLLENGLRHAPDSYQAFMPLAEEKIAQHDLETATKILDELNRMFPDNIRIAIAKAEILLLKAYPLQAVEMINARITQTPDKFIKDKIKGYLLLSRAYRTLGDWEQARQAQKQADAIEAQLNI